MLKSVKKISLIGAGNVAWHLGQAWFKKGIEIEQVYSRTLCHSTDLSSIVGAKPLVDLENLNPDIDLLVVSVPDDQITTVVEQLPKDICIVQTSGVAPLSTLINAGFNDSGIVYPLQTFSKERNLNIENIPFLIESSDNDIQSSIEEFVSLISNQISYVTSEKRKVIHLAAVFACNFSNNLWGIASNILQQKGFSFQLLESLLHETLDKALFNEPFSVQTGPAVRGDKKTIEAHLNMLDDNDYKEIYSLMSKHISKKKEDNNE